MQEDNLNNCDSEDVDDILQRIELSFDIKFRRDELQDVKTFGELCDIIVSKMPLADVQDCTSQQAFYKLRTAIIIATHAAVITPESQLSTLLPIKSRKIIWRSVERQLGFKLSIIGPSTRVQVAVLIAFLASFATFFLDAKSAGLALVASFLLAFLASKFGNTLHITTISECVVQMTREQYIKSRRNPDAINHNEIERHVQAIFMDGLALPASALTREATFV
jgi:hypothetical protein